MFAIVKRAKDAVLTSAIPEEVTSTWPLIDTGPNPLWGLYQITIRRGHLIKENEYFKLTQPRTTALVESAKLCPPVLSLSKEYLEEAKYSKQYTATDFEEDICRLLEFYLKKQIHKGCVMAAATISQDMAVAGYYYWVIGKRASNVWWIDDDYSLVCSRSELFSFSDSSQSILQDIEQVLSLSPSSVSASPPNRKRT